jgi:hypothetical protein
VSHCLRVRLRMDVSRVAVKMGVHVEAKKKIKFSAGLTLKSNHEPVFIKTRYSQFFAASKLERRAHETKVVQAGQSSSGRGRQKLQGRRSSRFARRQR